MEFTGEFTVTATPEQIWRIITDPEELTRCIPGAEDIHHVDDDTYTGTITRSVAGFTLSLSGEVELTEQDPYDRMAATVSAGDNSAGTWTKVSADMAIDLVAEGDETTLSYTVTADVKGKLASLGSSLVKPKVKADIEEYFAAVEERARQA